MTEAQNGKETVYLIDGSAYIYRAFFAVAPLFTKSGLPTQAVFGFINIIRRLLREKEPRYLAVAFDSRGPVFRHQLYPDYKANRPSMPDDLAIQVPYIRRFVEAANILCLQTEGVEADDLLASAARQLVASGMAVVIVSGDKDLLQLVDSHISLWEPMKDVLYQRDAVVAKYNVPPEKLLDLFSLVGDSSDNVPGIPGIGPKSAEKLINEYGSLDGLYAAIDQMKASKNKERLQRYREQAYLSKDLIRLKTDAEVPLSSMAYALQKPHNGQLRALFTELEFHSFLHDTPDAKRMPTDGFQLVDTLEKLALMLAQLQKADFFSIDTETNSLNARHAQLVGISFAVSKNQAWYIPLGHKSADGTPAPGQIDEQMVRDAVSPILTDASSVKIGHNLKFDYTVLACCWQVHIEGQLIDTLIAAHLLEIECRSLKLDDLCEKVGLKLTSFSEVTENDSRADAFAFVSPQAACDYSCEDVCSAYVLYESYQPQLSEKGLEHLFFDVEMPLIPVLAAMEIAGICLNTEQLEILSHDFQEKMHQVEEQIYALAGQKINIMSPKQLGELLFEQLQLPHGKKTKTGYSTDVSVLEKLAGHHPLPAKILEYRTIAKLLATYVEKLASLLDTGTGRVHTSFNQAVTATGRLSSTNPNLQNIPIRSEDGNRIRQAFVPAKGQVFLSADYSQIDLRVLAHYSQDPALLAAFQLGDDIHSRTAVEVFGVSPHFVTAEMRRVAKSINFGIVYGMSSFGLANQLGISRKEAQTFIDRYFKHYAGVQQFMLAIINQARRQGYVTTLLGRRRILPDINAKNKVTREFAERTAINTPIQGTAAEIIKMAMLLAGKDLLKAAIPAQLLLQIHDELVFELAPQWCTAASSVIKKTMENALPIAVPLLVNIKQGNTLAG